MNYAKLLKQSLDPVAYRIRRYSKAARKRRILKKWRNRFGPDMSEMMLEELKRPQSETLFGLNPKLSEAWRGAPIQIPWNAYNL